MSEESTWSVVVIVLGIAFCFLVGSVRGCAREENVKQQRAEEQRAYVQAECLGAGHAALECKELR